MFPTSPYQGVLVYRPTLHKQRPAQISYNQFVIQWGHGGWHLVGAQAIRSGPTYIYPILPPTIQYGDQDALVPPPMQFTTANGSLQGAVDGVNDTFATSVNLSRMQVARNGVSQTLNVDVAAPWGQYVKFLPGSIPQQGDLITVSGWTNL